MKKILSFILLTDIKSIETLIDSDNFLEAEEHLEILIDLHGELGDHYISKDINIEEDKLIKRLENFVNEILQRHHFNNIHNYALDPPRNILSKLKTTDSHHALKYHQAHAKIIDIIINSFNLELNNISTGPLADRIIKIQLLNNSLQFLSDELQNLLNGKINEVLQHMINTKETYERTLEFFLNNIDKDEQFIGKLSSLGEQLKKEKLDELINRLREQTLKKLYIYGINIQTYLDKNDIPSALDLIKKIFKYKTDLNKIIPEVEDIYRNANIIIKKKFSKFL